MTDDFSEYISYAIKTTIVGAITFLIIAGYIFMDDFKNMILHIIKWWKQRNYKKKNIIPIIHKINSCGCSGCGSGYIDLSTQTEFIKSLNELDENKDIHIILHTTGGSLSSSEAICNALLNHTGKGKIIAYIPEYCYSGGFMIALHCDKIIMQKNAVVGPCDAQKSNGFFENYHSYSSVLKAVEYKKGKSEKISETWLANGFDAELTKQRQFDTLKKLVKNEKYDKETAEKIFDEFFSGKHNHDKNFSVDELIEIGLNVEKVNKMPSMIDKIFVNY